MCGIVGITLQNIGSVKSNLINPLRRLEYRGYDSCGYATSQGGIEKGVGKIGEFVNTIEDAHLRTGICHTRWATHGGKTWENAHPHTNESQTIFAVHNGIIENCQELKTHLEAQGYKFTSLTDTEIIPHYFDLAMKQGLSVPNAIQKFFLDVKGTFAVLLMFKGDNKIYAFKKDSPLVLGAGTDFNILASDIFAFCNRTTRAIFFEDNEYAIVTSNGVPSVNDGWI